MTSNKQSVLITGGLGQIGYFTYHLLKEDYDIYILDNKAESKFDPPSDVKFYEGNIQNDEIYTKIPSTDIIIHCAAQISINKSIDNPLFDAEVNIIGTLKLLRFARRNKIKKFIYLSSAATIGHPQFLPITEEHPRNPISPYGFSKYFAEKYVLLYSDLYDMNTVILVPFNLYSPLQKETDPYAGVIYKFITAVIQNKSPKIEGDGEQTRDFIHTKDIANAIKLVIEKDIGSQRVFNIGSGNGITINELAAMIIRISGKNISPKFVDERIGDIKQSYCSIEKAQTILGFSPSIDLETGLKELYNHIKGNLSS